MSIFRDMRYAFEQLDLVHKCYDDVNEVHLSPRQKQVLFLLVLGRSPKEIACYISKHDTPIEPTTVTAIINKQLYKKFEVDNTSELIITAVMREVFHHIPSFQSPTPKKVREKIVKPEPYISTLRLI